VIIKFAIDRFFETVPRFEEMGDSLIQADLEIKKSRDSGVKTTVFTPVIKKTTQVHSCN